MDEVRIIEYLLQNIVSLNDKYKAVSSATGEDFNIFRILHIENREVETHSSLLSELLNPKGSHQRGERFLDLFLEQVNLSNYLNAKYSRVETEMFVGPKSQKHGGRVDIVIADNANNMILIENKIYARDQENQMLRLSNYSKNAKLFYLTLDGRQPSDFSLGNELLESDYSCLSYEKDIIAWLELCKKEAVNQPILRESITQYIYLIKYLTNQNLNKNMEQEIVKITTRDSDNLKAYFELLNSEKKVRNAILEKLGEDLNSLIEEEWEDISIGFHLLEEPDNYPSIRIQSEKLTKANLIILFEFDGNIDKDFYFGLKYINQSIKSISPELKTKFQETFNSYGKYGETGNGIFIEINNEYKRWNRNIYLKIFEGEFKNYFRGILNKMMDILE